jgi:putative Mg2+ transporter-C (MgtC) family protein
MIETITTFDIITRLIIAALLAGAFGLDREMNHRPAGLRTNILVGLSSTLMMLISLQFTEDPARIAAGVVTGIGFIGAGLIINTKDGIHGITTAATIWIVSAIGLAVGLGYYSAAILTTIIGYGILHFMVEDKVVKVFQRDEK